ncbi:hypothetical protein ACFWY9_08845 [Amycolatopsis sp. NPDC059027]|uniref:hypothetical protein n=1 Tax=Amycolatopsis sp. NPDC059027 TaxID=3346709 RepID=UPI0036709D82
MADFDQLSLDGDGHTTCGKSVFRPDGMGTVSACPVVVREGNDNRVSKATISRITDRAGRNAFAITFGDRWPGAETY